MMKKLKPYLLASICLNLVLIGLMVGGAWRGHQMRPKNGPTDEIGAIMFSVSPDIRDELRVKFGDLASKRDANTQEMMRLPEIIAQVPFEKERLEAYFSNRRSKSSEIAGFAHVELLEAIATMSDEERLELAERLKKRPMRRGNAKPPSRN